MVLPRQTKHMQHSGASGLLPGRRAPVIFTGFPPSHVGTDNPN